MKSVPSRMRLNRHPVTRCLLKVGQKLAFEGESQKRWTVRAVSKDGRWAICTKPYNPKRTVLYTVIDFDSGVRGPDDYGGLGYETEEQIADAMAMFEQGEAEVSVRYDMYLKFRDDQ